MQVKSQRLTFKVRVWRHRPLFISLLAESPLCYLSDNGFVIGYAVNVNSLV